MKNKNKSLDLHLINVYKVLWFSCIIKLKWMNVVEFLSYA
jgi:hypothetical protein